MGTSDTSGEGVAMKNADGTIVAIGSPQNDNSFNRAGHVRVFKFVTSSDSWELLGNDIQGEAASDLFGSSVSLSSEGTTVAIGGVFNAAAAKLAGYVRVFRYDSVTNEWAQSGADIDGDLGGDRFGSFVSLNGAGDMVAGGAPLLCMV